MPATSEKQKRFMDAAAHNPAFAKAAGVPQNVAKDFSESSKGMKFGKGTETRADLQKVNKPEVRHGKSALFKKGGETMAKTDMKKLFKGKETYAEELKEAKAIKSGKITPQQYARGEESEKKMTKMARGGGVESKGKTKGKVIAMCGGGKAKK